MSNLEVTFPLLGTHLKGNVYTAICKSPMHTIKIWEADKHNPNFLINLMLNSY